MNSAAWTAGQALPDQAFSKEDPFNMSVYLRNQPISNKTNRRTIDLVAGAFSSSALKARLSGEDFLLDPKRVYSDYRTNAVATDLVTYDTAEQYAGGRGYKENEQHQLRSRDRTLGLTPLQSCRLRSGNND
jgi:hypothetical protein